MVADHYLLKSVDFGVILLSLSEDPFDALGGRSAVAALHCTFEDLDRLLWTAANLNEDNTPCPVAEATRRCMKIGHLVQHTSLTPPVLQ